jgi:hypothetical protein
MLIQQLFDLIGSAQDLIGYFDGVTTPQQLASRLEMLKRGEIPQDLFEDLEALRISTAAALSANLEIGGTIEGEEKDEVDDLLEGLDGFTDGEVETSEPSKPATEKAETSDNAPDKPAA